MQIYALFDDNGLPKGFFTPVIHADIPAGAVRISVEDWHEFITNMDRRRWDGEKVVEYVPAERLKANARTLIGRLPLIARKKSKKML